MMEAPHEEAMAMVKIMNEWIPGREKERRGVSNRGVSEIAGHGA